MSEVFTVVAGILLSVGTLAINHKWAGIDPHNPAAGPSWLWAVIGALKAMALFPLALQLKTEGHPFGAGVVSAFALGRSLGPSISTPHKMTKDEEPLWIMRLLEGVRVSMGGGVLKSLILIPLTPIVGLLAPSHAAFWAAGLLAIGLGALKAPVLMLMLQDPTIAAAFAKSGNRLIGGSVLLSCLVGTAALGVWLCVILPLVDFLPLANLHDYVAFGGFLAGVILR